MHVPHGYTYTLHNILTIGHSGISMQLLVDYSENLRVKVPICSVPYDQGPGPTQFVVPGLYSAVT